MVLTGATFEVTNDGTQVVSKGPIYKNERHLDLQFELESNETSEQSNVFAQKDTIFATKNKTVSFNFSTVLGALTETTTLNDGLVDLLMVSNLSMVEGTAVGGKKVFDFTPTSERKGLGSILVKTVDRTIEIEQVSASISIEMSKGEETKLSFDVTGVVKTDTSGQTNTLVDPVKPKASVLSTTDGINTGISVNSNELDAISVNFTSNLDRKIVKGLVETQNLINDADYQLSVNAYLSSGTFEEGFDAIVNGTEIAINIDYEDTSDAIIWGLSVPKAKVMGTPNRADSEGVYTIEKQYRCRPTTGNDNFVLKYYSNITAA